VKAYLTTAVPDGNHSNYLGHCCSCQKHTSQNPTYKPIVLQLPVCLTDMRAKCRS
jgi:hypothetical protein